MDIPALGCTEPVCAALAAADAAKAAGGEIKTIRLSVSRNIYKNGVSVGIAGYHKVGLNYAAALGALIGPTRDGLEIMRGITPAIGRRAAELVRDGAIVVELEEKESGIYVRCEVTTSDGTGMSVIQGAHTNIVLTQANERIVYQAEKAAGAGKNSGDRHSRGRSIHPPEGFL